MSNTDIYDKICATVSLERSQGKDCVLLVLDRYAMIQLPNDKIIKEWKQGLESKGRLILKDESEIAYECLCMDKPVTKKLYNAVAGFGIRGRWATFDSNRQLIP